MRKRLVQFTSFVIIIACLSGGTALAQRRRATLPRQRRAPLLVPLTENQKDAVTELIKQAEEIDYDYKFRRQKDLWAKASGLWGQADRVAELLPEGNLKKLTLATGQAYHDAAVIYCAYTDQLGYYTREDVMHVANRLGMQKSSPYEMVVITFGAAGMLKDSLSAALDKSPTAEARSKPSAQPEAEAGWAFPTEGMRGEYNADINGMVYDLGNGIYAGHTKFGGSPVVMVVFSKSFTTEKVDNFDLAIAVAYKVVALPKQMADTVMGQNKIGEHLFRTASGKVVGVSIPPDRKSAVVRFIQNGQEQ
jgi:hypothetical protein